MALRIPERIYAQITAHLEAAFPTEGAGLLLGDANGRDRNVGMALTFENRFSPDKQHNRYLLTAEDMLAGENTAEKHSMDVVGVFHSHPDHPACPSEYDREHALPWYSYLIISVNNSGAGTARSWLLVDDRTRFNEERVHIQTGH
jgi:proteasome lid subunit RPN8/RPN11